MNLKKIISSILGVFVLTSIGFIIYNESVNVKKPDPNQVPILDETSAKKWIDATYFYTTKRCYTCKLMEQYIKESLNEEFGEQIQQKKINFQTINVDLPENSHYIQDYQLYTKSFVLSLKNSNQEDSWSNCDKIWKLVRDEQRFKKYIGLEVKKYLEML